MDADLGGTEAVTDQKSAKFGTHWHKISTSIVRLLAVNHLESDISVE